MNSPQTKRLNHWTFQNRDQILPVHAVTFKSVLIPILKEHKSITISEDLFMDIIGMILKVDHLYFPAVFGHEYKNITIVWIMMRHLLDNLEQAAIATAHISHSRDIVEALQARYRQHRSSSFSTNS